jgi:hypothetical protein
LSHLSKICGFIETGHSFVRIFVRSCGRSVEGCNGERYATFRRPRLQLTLSGRGGIDAMAIAAVSRLRLTEPLPPEMPAARDAGTRAAQVIRQGAL